MAKNIQLLIVALLLLVLAIVIFVPSLGLEPTALRAARAAALLFFAMFSAARLFLCSCPSLPPRNSACSEFGGPNAEYLSRLGLCGLRVVLRC